MEPHTPNAKNPAEEINQNRSGNFAIPAAIVAAGALIALAILITKTPTEATPATALLQTADIPAPAVSQSEHILGSANADIVAVEYSDTECPFCKVYQQTLHRIVTEYSDQGKIAWAYRQFPLYKPNQNGQALHPKSEKESEALECVNELGGNDKFWQYLDSIFQVTPSNNGLDPAQLPLLAKNVGIDQTAFNKCLSTGKYAARISQAVDDAQKIGGQGTPYTILFLKNKIGEKKAQAILASVKKYFAVNAPNATLPADLITFDKDGKKIIFSGALPYEVVKIIVDSVLQN